MTRLAITLVVVACVGASLAAIALGADRSRKANLDSDPALERVVGRLLCQATDGSLHPPQPACGSDQFPRRRVEVEDTCAGAPVSVPISSAQDVVFKLRVTEADGATARPEVFFDLRSGASGRVGDVRVVRYDDVSGGCPAPHDLFRYPSRRTLGRIPHGAVGRDSFSIAVRDYTRRFRGKELEVLESYVDHDDAFCCPTYGRTSFFRFKRKLDRYVRYETHVRRLKR
jgi:hypothetical protein